MVVVVELQVMVKNMTVLVIEQRSPRSSGYDVCFGSGGIGVFEIGFDGNHGLMVVVVMFITIDTRRFEIYCSLTYWLVSCV